MNNVGIERNKGIKDSAEAVKRHIDNKLDDIMDIALKNYYCYAPNADSILMDSIFPASDRIEYKEALSFLKSNARSFIQSALVAEATLLTDVKRNNIASADKIFSLYNDFSDGYSNSFTCSLDDTSEKKVNYNTIKRAEGDLNKAVTGISTTPNKSEISRDQFIYQSRIFKSTYEEGFSSIFCGIPFFKNFSVENSDKFRFPISFSPFLGFTSLNLSGQDSLFKKTSSFLLSFCGTTSRSKMEPKVETISKRYNEIIMSETVRRIFRAQEPACIIEANRFLFDMLLHPEFFISLNCDIADVILQKIRIAELIEKKPEKFTDNIYTHLLHDESYFFIELLGILMRFNVNLCSLDELTFFTEKTIPIIRFSDVNVLKSISPLRCIDINIAFYHSMRFVYNFFDLVDSSLEGMITDLLHDLILINEDKDFITDVLNELVPKHSYAYGNRVELTREDMNQELTIIYLLNSCAHLTPHADILCENQQLDDFVTSDFLNEKDPEEYIKKFFTEGWEDESVRISFNRFLANHVEKNSDGDQNDTK